MVTKMAMMLIARLCFALAQASDKPQPVQILITMNGFVPENDTLEFFLWRDAVFSQRLLTGDFGRVSCSERNIEINFSEVTQPGRISLFARRLNPNYILEKQLVEPGDKITIVLSVKVDGSYQMKASGHGAAKYQLSHDLKTLRESNLLLESQVEMKETTIKKALQKNAIIQDEVIEKWKQYRAFLSSLAGPISSTDLLGESQKIKLRLLSLAYAQATGKEKLTWRKKLEKFTSQSNHNLQNNAIPFSRTLLELEYEKQKWKTVVSKDGNYQPLEFTSFNTSITFADVFQNLKTSYKNPLKESLLAFTLRNHLEIKLFFGGCHPDEYTKCLSEAIETCEDVNTKTQILQTANRFGKGAQAYEFALPSAAGDTVRLSDLKGNMLLIDIWTEGCTACRDFKKEIVEHLLPLIREKSDIRVVSIGSMDDHNRWLQALTKNSHSDFINLFLDSHTSNSGLAAYYEFSYAPLILLIDKEGKLITSTARNVLMLKDLMAIGQLHSK